MCSMAMASRFMTAVWRPSRGSISLACHGYRCAARPLSGVSGRMRAIWHPISPAPAPARDSARGCRDAGGTTREILADLIGFPTVSRDPNRQLIDYCAGRGDVGVESHIIGTDEGTKANLFATIGPPDRPGVMLSGHGCADRRPGLEEARLRGDRGRRPNLWSWHGGHEGFCRVGAGGARQAATMELKTPLHLALSYDEEIGASGCAR